MGIGRELGKAGMTGKDGVFTLKLDDGITPSCLEVSSGMSPGVSLAEIGIWPADVIGCYMD